MKYLFKKGQIVLSLGVTISVVLAFVGGASAFFVDQGKQNGRIDVIEEREDNHYAELNKRLDSIDDNIKTLLKSQGITVK